MAKNRVTTKNIDEYFADDRNINKGSDHGSELLNKSLSEVGAGRSLLADKNGVMIAGNKTMQAAKDLGISEVIEVETTGNQLVVVKRTDMDINSPEGVKMKILDNTVSKHNYVEDAVVMDAICEEYEIDAEEYGLKTARPVVADGEDEDSGYDQDQEQQWYLNIQVESEKECQKLYDQFIKQGLNVKIVT